MTTTKQYFKVKNGLEFPRQDALTVTDDGGPSIRPSLLLDFAKTKKLDPRITFSRPTTATYYDGKTVVKAEENLLISSQDFDNAAWLKQLGGTGSAPTVTANYGVAPDGTNTADRVQFNLNGGTTSSDFSSLRSSPALPNALYTISIWLKTNDGTDKVINLDDGQGTINNITVTGTWQRFSYTNPNALGVLLNLRLRGAWGTSDSADLLVWGAQLEQRSTVTAYTPTTTAPITNYIPALQTCPVNSARFDHDPITGESKGLLIEEQRTNLVTYSDQFDNAAWTKNRSSITANATIAPDGTITADRLVEDTTNGSHNISRLGFSFTASTTYTISFYAKAAGRNFVTFRTSGLAFPSSLLYFNLTNGVIATSTSGAVTASSSTNVGNGWYRCTATFTATSTTTDNLLFDASPDASNFSYTGDGYSGIYIWGAQLEAGSFPTSYIPTVASQVTRSADSASMTGSNFSSWYRADEGTLFCEGAMPASATYGAACYMTKADNTNNNLVGLLVDTRTAYTASITTNSSAQTAWTFSSQSPNTFYKHTLSYKTNDAAYTSNGSAVLTDASVTLPSLADIRIGASGTQTLGGYIKRIAYYPKRLSNTELQSITS